MAILTRVDDLQEQRLANPLEHWQSRKSLDAVRVVCTCAYARMRACLCIHSVRTDARAPPHPFPH